MAKQQPKNETNNKTAAAVVPLMKRPRIDPGPCPTNSKHRGATVYKTLGRKRYCKCNDCGETWSMIAPYADEDTEFLNGLADLFLTSEAAVGPTGDRLVCMAETEARALGQTLKAIVEK